jgi:hypothetical protein
MRTDHPQLTADIRIFKTDGFRRELAMYDERDTR